MMALNTEKIKYHKLVKCEPRRKAAKKLGNSKIFGEIDKEYKKFLIDSDKCKNK